EENARPAPAGGKRGGKTGGSAADDENVAMGETLLVMIGIGALRRPPHPGGTADEMLVEAPRPFRSHERLVVEAGWEQRRDERRRRAEVEAERGKAVLALRHEPIIELDHRGAGVGLGTRVAAQA